MEINGKSLKQVLKQRTEKLQEELRMAKIRAREVEMAYDEKVEAACIAGADFSALDLLGPVLREQERRKSFNW